LGFFYLFDLFIGLTILASFIFDELNDLDILSLSEEKRI